MRDEALAAIRQYGMLSPGDTVIAAFSGGADSTALLFLLWEEAAKLGITVRAAHVNHNLRGLESARDERFAREFCEERGIELEVLCLHRVAGEAKAAGMGVEEYARTRRYAFFAELAARHGARVATAHTASDSLETTLFHLARGTGLRGLCGIPPVRGVYIRPLIGVTRAQVEAYCAEHGLSYVTDSTNADTAFARNRIRHNVVPALHAAHPGLEHAYPRLRSALEADDDYLNRAALAALEECARDGGCDAAALAALHPALRFRVFRRFAQEHGATLDAAKAELLLAHLGDEGFALELSRGCILEVRGGLLQKRAPKAAFSPFELPVSEGVHRLPDGRTVEFEIRNCEDSKKLENFAQISLKNFLDYDRIQNGLLLRTRRAGDKICLAGRGVTKTFKNLFQEAGLTQGQRAAALVLADEEGAVWLQGFGCALRATPGPTTRRVLAVKITGEDTAWKTIF